MDKQTLLAARRFSQKLRKKYKVQKLILFGSRARGDNLKTSDFDFIIVSDDFKGKPFIFRPSELYDLWSETVDIEPLVYTEKEFDHMKKRIGIVQTAVKEGIEL